MNGNSYFRKEQLMKVFISWSGTRSKKVALIFRDWLPSVIQSIEPFVSSEDIEKGSRWNTDIAQELKESTFGIICVTKDNLTAPWLNFEAGALSKTIENSYVVPFLFDVKPSELKGSPISQFQATLFTKDDLKRLLETLNAATGNCLSEQKLLKAFEVWYPDLEQNLKALESEPNDNKDSDATTVQPDILEELLEMSRNTQRLLGNTDTKLYNNFEQLQKRIEEVIAKSDRIFDIDERRYARKMHPMFAEKMFYMMRNNEESDNIFPYNLLILLSVYRNDFPWLYDAGSELVKVIQSTTSKKSKGMAIRKFQKILDFTTEHPMMRESFRFSKDSMMMLHELPMRLMDQIEMYIDDTELK